MNAPLRTTSRTLATDASAALRQLPSYIVAAADRCGVEIVWNKEGFGILYDDEVFSTTSNPEEIFRWLSAFELGNDAIRNGVFAELVAAEQIIQTMAAQMTDKQKLAAAESLVSAGFPFEDASRCKQRRAAIAAARKAGAE